MDKDYKGPERRKFLRLLFRVPLAFKVCKDETIDKLLQGYTADISQSGLLCNINNRVEKDDILWLSFDRDILNICEELEKRTLIYQKGIIAKVVRIVPKENNTYNVGLRFITREEKDASNVFPRFKILTRQPEKRLNDA